MKTKITNLFFLLPILFLFFSCSNDDRIFTLKTIELKEYTNRDSLPEQTLYLKVFSDDSETNIGETDGYPSKLPLPATFNVHSAPKMYLYAKPYHVELWGDASGFIGSGNIDMDDYKIIFPLDMDIKSETLEVAIQGTWE